MYTTTCAFKSWERHVLLHFVCVLTAVRPFKHDSDDVVKDRSSNVHNSLHGWRICEWLPRRRIPPVQGSSHLRSHHTHPKLHDAQRVMIGRQRFLQRMVFSRYLLYRVTSNHSIVLSEERVASGALEAVDDPFVVQTKLWTRGWDPVDKAYHL